MILTSPTPSHRKAVVLCALETPGGSQVDEPEETNNPFLLQGKLKTQELLRHHGLCWKDPLRAYFWGLTRCLIGALNQEPRFLT